MTKRTATAAPSPTTYSVLRGRPVRSLAYPLALRVHDWWAGRRDGRIDLSAIGASGHAGPTALTAPGTAWLTHDHHRELERRTDEQLAHQARTLGLQVRHDTVLADLATAERQLAQARQRLEGLAPLTEEDVGRRGATEMHTAPAVVRQRRRREHQAAVVGPAQRQAAEAQARVAALTAELHDLAAQLVTLAEVAATRQARIAELHGRRRALYRRAYLQALSRVHRRAHRHAGRRTPSGPSSPPPARCMTQGRS